ncbi:PilZ domain-containing protein [Paenibacillus sp. JMULE4]|uniref:PilZ domain-containing protein n=1 Tax=Paenibacillus sp. JMULE4 TaxID=2518342 RepID=UPI001575A7C9|nr:PilZ domain-containing protein [Paenibacillus sp. JMULE4]NTZ18366.1 PilZ domain-containing protein [Paenibacillus sp. JMULE4]
MSNANRRHFFRLPFQHPLCAELKMIDYKGLMPESRIVKAALLDLSAGGARFRTAAPLPDDDNLLVELKFTVMQPVGTIVRSMRSEEEHDEYSIQFSWNEADIAALTGVLNQMAVKLRNKTVLPGCSFCTEEDLLEFKRL